ncbi:MAG: transposase [Lysobacteraceae bacterium]
MSLHLADAEGGNGNHRNGRSGKTVLTDDGPLRIDVPRDRSGTFEPQLIPKHERRFAGFDERIVSMYARGMTVREIQGHLAEMYRVEVSPEFISKVTDEVMVEVAACGTATGDDVSGGVLRRTAGKDPRGRGGAQQGRVPGAGRAG